MANLATNRGKYNLLSHRYRGASLPANLFVLLASNTSPPTADSNTVADISEVTAGNGYTSGGISLTPGATDFDTLTEDDTNDRAFVQIRDLVWTASGGNLPSSNNARWAVLTGPNATVANRELDVAWDLSSDRFVSDGQTLTLQNLEIRLS